MSVMDYGIPIPGSRFRVLGGAAGDGRPAAGATAACGTAMEGAEGEPIGAKGQREPLDNCCAACKNRMPLPGTRLSVDEGNHTG